MCDRYNKRLKSKTLSSTSLVRKFACEGCIYSVGGDLGVVQWYACSLLCTSRFTLSKLHSSHVHPLCKPLGRCIHRCSYNRLSMLPIITTSLRSGPLQYHCRSWTFSTRGWDERSGVKYYMSMCELELSGETDWIWCLKRQRRKIASY